MANKQRGEITVTIKGKEWTLVPTFNAMVEFEDKTNAGAYEILQKYITTKAPPSFKVSAAALWSGIRGGMEDMTEAPSYQKCGELIQSYGSVKFADIVIKYLMNAVASDEDLEQSIETAKNE